MNDTSHIAVITGGSRGIGKEVARQMLLRGFHVVLLGRSQDALDNAMRSLSPTNMVSAYRCDVVDENNVSNIAKMILHSIGTPRIVVNNAGIVYRGKLIEETNLEEWNNVISVNLNGPFLVTSAFLPAMRRQRHGRFIHISSISGTIGSPGAASYCASKWGLIGFHKTLTEELRGSGLQSVAILPGSVDTEMLVGSDFSPDMTASDVANTIVYAALDAPDAIHGSSIEIFG